jgi:hypothetical protein
MNATDGHPGYLVRGARPLGGDRSTCCFATG